MSGAGDIKTNDGGGLMDNIGMIDSLIVDCNENVKKLLAGQYIAFCKGMYDMVNKLGLLKAGVKNDTEDLQRQIRELRELLQQEGGREDASGSVCDALDGAVGSGQERLRDVITAAGSGLEPDQDHAGA